MKKVVVFLVLSFLLSSCHVGRFVFWNFADADDYKKFHNAPIKNQKRFFIIRPIRTIVRLIVRSVFLSPIGSATLKICGKAKPRQSLLFVTTAF
jgi:hypothetical protein